MADGTSFNPVDRFLFRGGPLAGIFTGSIEIRKKVRDVIGAHKALSVLRGRNSGNGNSV
jgi:hypothetical protein